MPSQMSSMLDQIQSLGYNTIRVPFSNQLFDAGSTPNSVDASGDSRPRPDRRRAYSSGFDVDRLAALGLLLLTKRIAHIKRFFVRVKRNDLRLVESVATIAGSPVRTPTTD